MTSNVYDGFSNELMEHLQHRNYAEIKNCLIGMDCPSRLVDRKGATLLHYAAIYENARTAKYLLNSGFQIDLRDHIGYTPLMYDVRYLSGQTAELLIQYGANIYARCNFGKTVLQMALSRGNSHINKIFLYKLRRDYSTNEALADVLHKNLVGSLHPIIYLRNAEVTRLLIGKGHSPCDIFRDITCLDLAIQLSDIENVKLLIEYGMNVNACSPGGDYPVNYIPIWNTPRKFEILKLLLDNGTDFICKQPHGLKTRKIPIYEIFEYGTREMVRLLVQTYREFIKENSSELLYYLAFNDNEGVIDEIQDILLVSGNANFTSERRRSIALSNIFDSKHSSKWKLKRLKILLEHGADLQREFYRCKDNQLTTPLQEAVLANELQLTKALLAHTVLRQRLLQLTVSPKTLHMIESDDRLKSYFRLYKRHIEIMNNISIRASVTLLDLLTKDVTWIACRVRNQNLDSELTCLCNNYRLNAYFLNMLKKRSIEIVNVINIRRDAACVYEEIFGHLYNQNHLVMDKTVSFISTDNLRKVLRARDNL